MRFAGVLLLVMAALGGTTPPKLLTFTLGEKPAEIVSRFGAMPNVVPGRESTRSYSFTRQAAKKGIAAMAVSSGRFTSTVPVLFNL